MADVALVQSGTNNGTVTPATPGSLTTTNHNLLVLVIAALGTSPTIGVPASWAQVKANASATFACAMFILPNNPGGATNPSSVLGGTITGWIAAMFEFSNTGTNEGLLQSAANGFGSATTLPNIFVGLPVIYNNLFIYTVARSTATITPQNTNGNWSNSIQPLAGVQGMSLDTYWMSNQQQGYWPPPSAAGILGSAVQAVQIGAILNSAASTVNASNNIGGLAGVLVASGGVSPNVGGSPTAINSGYGGEVPGQVGSGAFFSGMIGG